MRVEFTRRADRDLSVIWASIGSEESEAAALWMQGLILEALSLETLPLRGTETRENSHLRQLLYGRKPDVYRIIYSVHPQDGVVYIRQVRHGARRPIK